MPDDIVKLVASLDPEQRAKQKFADDDPEYKQKQQKKKAFHTYRKEDYYDLGGHTVDSAGQMMSLKKGKEDKDYNDLDWDHEFEDQFSDDEE